MFEVDDKSKTVGQFLTDKATPEGQKDKVVKELIELILNEDHEIQKRIAEEALRGVFISSRQAYKQIYGTSIEKHAKTQLEIYKTRKGDS